MTTLEIIKSIIVNELQFGGAADATLNSSLVNDIGLDSLDKTDLMMVLEETFNISIDDKDIGKLHTLGDVVNYVETKIH